MASGNDGAAATLYWLLALGVFVLAVYLLRSILLPFVLGVAVAYFLDPVADWLERRRLSRTLAATLLTVAFLVGVGLFFALLVPLLQSQLFGFVGRIPAYAEMFRVVTEDLLSIVQANLSEEAIARLREAAGGLASATVSWLGGRDPGPLERRSRPAEPAVAGRHHADRGVLPPARLGQDRCQDRRLAAARSCGDHPRAGGAGQRDAGGFRPGSGTRYASDWARSMP